MLRYNDGTSNIIGETTNLVYCAHSKIMCTLVNQRSMRHSIYLTGNLTEKYI